MTTNTSTTQSKWDQFRQKCAEREEECSNLQDISNRLGDIFGDFENTCNRLVHTYQDLKDECHRHEMSYDESGLQLFELGKKIKELSDNCITLGLKNSNQQLNEYADEAKKLKGVITEIESKIPEIELKLTSKIGSDFVKITSPKY